MKSFKLTSIFFLFTLLLMTMPSFTSVAEIEGEWTFEVENAPYGYEKGEITISKEGDAYKAVVAINYSKLSGKKVSVEGNAVSFNVYVEGMPVEISMDIDGDSFTGKAASGEGTFKLIGKRK